MLAFPVIGEPLSDGVVALRPSTERDIPEILIAYQEDRHLHECLGQRRPPSGAQLGSAFERAARLWEDGTRAELTILEPGADVCVGQVFVHKLEWEHGRGELGIWVAPGVRGRGCATAALRLTARWLFEYAGLLRVALLTEPENPAMLGAAAAAGFMREGVLRSYGEERGRRVDLVVLSLLASDLS